MSNIRSRKETLISGESNIQMQQIETTCFHIAPLQYHQAAKREKPHRIPLSKVQGNDVLKGKKCHL
jgi:hypothetical protein